MGTAASFNRDPLGQESLCPHAYFSVEEEHFVYDVKNHLFFKIYFKDFESDRGITEPYVRNARESSISHAKKKKKMKNPHFPMPFFRAFFFQVFCVFLERYLDWKFSRNLSNRGNYLILNTVMSKTAQKELLGCTLADFVIDSQLLLLRDLRKKIH